MYRIVGLWNDEEKYQDTAHNIGGQILSEIFRKKEIELLKNSSSVFLDKKRQAKISGGNFCNQDFEIISPEGFINESGNVFSGIFSKDNEDKKNKIIVIYDDITLPFGKIKISFDRGDGGHNGIKNIIKKLGTKKFIRIRIGVCPLDFFGNPRKPKGEAAVKYLINKKFSKKYLKMLGEIEKKVGRILEEIFKNGLEKSMNKFN
jgi:PTH1 family peptidyl-tRNA hydrolase